MFARSLAKFVAVGCRVAIPKLSSRSNCSLLPSAAYASRVGQRPLSTTASLRNDEDNDDYLNEEEDDFEYESPTTWRRVQPVGPKSPAPSFKGTAVVNGDFKEITLHDYKGKWLVLFFYPLDFTFVCPTEIIAFGDRSDEFRKLNCEVVACSCDSHFSHLAWVQTPRKAGGLGDMKIPILADFAKTTAAKYGVLDGKTGLAYRGLFLIDPQGDVRHCMCNDLPVGRSVDETLRLLKAFQFVDKHGEVCPADWEEGEPTIQPAKATDYFEKVNK